MKTDFIKDIVDDSQRDLSDLWTEYEEMLNNLSNKKPVSDIEWNKWFENYFEMLKVKNKIDALVYGTVVVCTLLKSMKQERLCCGSGKRFVV
jgi:hypothetical protein